MTCHDPEQYRLELQSWQTRRQIFGINEAERLAKLKHFISDGGYAERFLTFLAIVWVGISWYIGVHDGAAAGGTSLIVCLFICGALKALAVYLTRWFCRGELMVRTFPEPEPVFIEEAPPPAIESKAAGGFLTEGAPPPPVPHIPKVTWDMLIIPDSLRDKLQTYCEILRHAEAFRERGVTTPKGLLFMGPPGCGKTQTARVLAGESGLNFVGCTTADIKKGWLGHSGQAVKMIFAAARQNAPSVLFIDELEAITNDINSSPDTITVELTAQLLQEIDGIHADNAVVFVIGATNQPDRINRALMSRFTEKIAYPLPNLSERIRILSMLISHLPLGVEVDFFQVLAARCQGASGRDLRTMVERATIRAISRARNEGNSLDFALDAWDFVSTSTFELLDE